MVSLQLCLLTTTAAAVAVSDEAEFASFKARFGKSYGSPLEEARRLATFQRNLARTREDSTLGVTEFSDMTSEEFRAQYLGRRAGAARNATPAKWDGTCYSCTRFPELEQTPSALDWSSKGAVTPVKKQYCGDCYTFSATGDIEAANFLAGNDLLSLSEEQVIDCCMGDMGILACAGCNGGCQEKVFDWIVQKGGIDSEATYPYSVTKMYPHPGTYQADLLQPSKFSVELQGWFQISGDLMSPTEQNVDEAAMLEQLAKVGPFAISIDATDANMQHYVSGVANPSNCKSGVGQNRLDHAVLLVGFGTENDQDYWKIKNSWGAEWGEAGYYRIVRGENKCGMAEDAVHSIVSSSSRLVV